MYLWQKPRYFWEHSSKLLPNHFLIVRSLPHHQNQLSQPDRISGFISNAIALSLTVFPFKAIAPTPPKSTVSTRLHLWFHLKCDRSFSNCISIQGDRSHTTKINYLNQIASLVSSQMRSLFL
ncbi:hypothetical protein GTQ43_25480 [Nostoc sp. KVJ3]|uniref:hypothetical protein n=1 Tax=Nostoc sp. KVJ3 TaxID=457945 RepID=UPI002238914F|nr:hypothetical protein [Nostoc sp. KVJ3]MCW5317048.1 hypothetical protein [Nostoc sp. KVJ3]